ncbi:MAG: hypothetical protein NTU94_15925, partial [Planctomycetota bacterium]|nr:hypothetical protein [Planctomycetota bacterium]
ADDGKHGDELFRFLPNPTFTYQWLVAGGAYTGVGGQSTPNFHFTPTDLGAYTVTLNVAVAGSDIEWTDHLHVFVTDRPASVTAVMFNRPGQSVSDIEPGAIGVHTIVVSFSENVTFTADAVTVWAVTFPDGVEQIGDVQPAFVVTGSGTAAMTLIFEPGSVVDTWVKVVLNAAEVRDSAGNALDGEAAGYGGFIFSETDDLPTGNRIPGGDAVFYVGSLRGDFVTVPEEEPAHRVSEEDLTAFLAAFAAGDLTADFRGPGFGASPPDGLVTGADLDAFITLYNMFATEDRYLDPLPMRGRLAARAVPQAPPPAGDVQAAGDPEPVALEPAETGALALAGEAVGDVAPPPAPADDGLIASALPEVSLPPPQATATFVLSAGDLQVGLTAPAQGIELASAPAAAPPAVAPVLAPDGGLLGVLDLTVLEPPLQA